MRAFCDSSNQRYPANEWPNVIRNKLSMLNQDPANNATVLIQWFLDIRNKNPIVENDPNAFILSYVIECAYDIAQRSPTLLPNQNIYLQLLENLLTPPNLNCFIPELLASPASLSGHEHPYDFAIRIGCLQASTIFASAYRMIAQNFYPQLMRSQQEVLSLQQEVLSLQQEISKLQQKMETLANSEELLLEFKKSQETIQAQNNIIMQQTKNIEIMSKNIIVCMGNINKKGHRQKHDSNPQGTGLEEAQTNPSATPASTLPLPRSVLGNGTSQSMWRQEDQNNSNLGICDTSQFPKLGGSSRSKR